MYTDLDCIALRTIRYNDKHSILSAYTRQRGRISFLIPAGAGREAARRRALMMPLGQFACVADIRDSRQLHTIRDVRMRGTAAPGDPTKAMVKLFIADFLNVILRESQPDETLFLYLDYMIDRLQHSRRGTANFHLCFLLRLQRFLGIEPDISTYRPGYVFDMADGMFRPSAPLHGKYLDQAEARAAYTLMRMTPDNMHMYRMSQHDRNAVIDRLLSYYTIHFSNLQSMNSLDVLRDMLRTV